MNDLEMFAHYRLREKPRYRIQWEFTNGTLSGYYVKTQNIAAIILKPSFFVSMLS